MINAITRILLRHPCNFCSTYGFRQCCFSGADTTSKGATLVDEGEALYALELIYTFIKDQKLVDIDDNGSRSGGISASPDLDLDVGP
jgi:hypothetical protein